MAISDPWLKHFFESRCLEGPDGRMLHAYRLTRDEYDSLHRNLETWVAASSFNRLAQRDAAFCARFVLLAAEWWHRDYPGGPWRWDPIIELVSGVNEVDVGSRTACVENGFAFWGHRTGGAGKKYLGAVVAHGGLPLRALGQGIGTVSRILRDGLRLSVRYGWQEEQLMTAIAERSDGLPESLRKDEIYRLLADMVLTALDLRREYALAESADPIAVLQQRDEKWMERFPISLEEAAARPLLADLLKEASAQKSIATTTLFSVRRSLLRQGEDVFELQTTVSAPRQADINALANFFHVPTENLPGYFSIDLAGDEPWLDGRQQLGQVSSIRLDGKPRILRGSMALEEQTIVLRRRSVLLGEGPQLLPGGSAIPADQPWIFAEREGEWLLAGVGGARLPEQVLQIALPHEWRLIPDDSICGIEHLGFMRVSDSDVMSVYRLAGSARAEYAGDSFHIRSGQSAKLTELFTWEGRRLLWQPKRCPAFRGVPTLYRVAEDGTRARVPTSSIVWKAATGAKTTLAPHAVHGLVDALCIQDGEVLTRTRMLILADSAGIDFISGRNIATGSLRFRGFGSVCASVLTADVKASCETRCGETFLNLEANETPPESILVGVTQGGQELIFSLPFPASGGRFFDRKAQIMRDKERLSLHELEGCRLRIFDQNPDKPKRYALKLSLSCTERNARSLDEELPLPLPSNGIAEFRLIDVQRNIRAMLSFSDELDARVRLALTINDQVAHSIEVSHYAGQLERSEQGLLSLRTEDLSRTDSEALHSVHLWAAPLLHAETGSRELEQEHSEGVLSATWRTALLDEDKAPWLIFPAPDSSISVRPLIWGFQSGELPSDACALAKAMAISNSQERLAGIESALAAMGADYLDNSWSYLEHLCKTFSHLPLGALDVFRAIASEPAFAVAFAMRADAEVDVLCRRLGSELGFIWELTSARQWIEATQHLKTYYATKLPQEALSGVFSILLNDRREKLANALPSMRLLLELAGLIGGCTSASELQSLQTQAGRPENQICQHLWRGEDSLLQSMLLHGHDGENWPEPYFWQHALKALIERLNGSAKGVISQNYQTLLWEDGGFKNSVANMPVICALWTCSDTQIAWWKDSAHRLALRRLRAFDPEWFKEAYLAGLRACFALGLGLGKPSVRTQVAPKDLNGVRVFRRSAAY